MFTARIKAIYQDLTISEKLVADYILQNYEKVKVSTTYQIAKELNVGQSTIIRFSQKAGYKSFRELLSELSAANKNKYANNEISIEETTQVTNEKIVSQYHDIIQLTLNNNPFSIIDEAVNLIYKSSRIISYGVMNSNLSAEYLTNNLLNMGKDSFSSNSTHAILSKIPFLKKCDVLILFSESGETDEVIKAAKLAKSNGIKIITITRNSFNSVNAYADVKLSTVGFKDKTIFNATIVRVSQLCLIDMLILNLYKKDFDNYSTHLMNARELLSEGNEQKKKQVL